MTEVAAVDLRSIVAEIEAGLPNERPRLDCSHKNIDFYRGDFDAYPSRETSGVYQSPRYERHTLVMQRAVNVLSQHLYSRGPAREFPDNPDLTAWLQGEYKRCGLDGLMQEADALALAANVSAIQVVGTGDVEKPVRFQLWPASQFCVWEDATDPTKVIAVATIDLFDNTRRLRLWTADSMVTFQTDKLRPGQTEGGTAYRWVAEEENTYGCIPFAFIHVNRPTTEFWTRGPGTCLRNLNDWCNYSLTENGDNIRYAGKPIIIAWGVGGWRPEAAIQPGSVWYPPNAGTDEAGNGIPPDIKYLQADGGYVEIQWQDFQSFVDHTLQMVNVPPSTIRMVETSSKSGVALVVEQLPLIVWAEGRQSSFGFYERDLAFVTIQVGRAELERLGSPRPELDPAEADHMTLRWPSLVPDVPLLGQAQENADQRDLANGVLSRIQLVMRRYNLSREEAVAHLKSVADDLKEESAIGLPPVPALPASQGDSSDGQE